jgi:hypothetical protein
LAESVAGIAGSAGSGLSVVVLAKRIYWDAFVAGVGEIVAV